MKTRILTFLLLAVSVVNVCAQKVIPLYQGKAPGSEEWNWQEAEMYSEQWKTRIVYNVATPTLTVYLPPTRNANGAAVVICPGGAFHALSIDAEGIDVAKWLNGKGVAAFVLKYRLVKSETTDPVAEVSAKMANRKFGEATAKLMPLIVEDGLEAIKFVRKNAADFKVDPDRIGMMGFSAGGTVTTAVTFAGKNESRPDFVAPVYPYLPANMRDQAIPENAPPMFIVAASDDNLGLAPHSVWLYSKWMEAGKPVEMHLYQQGGHGFGMRTQHYPSDTWIDRFGDWLEVRGLLLPSDPNHPQRQFQRRKEAEENFRNDWANLGRFAEENRKLGPPRANEDRIVFMGNSITAGWSRLHPEFFAGKSYVNRGIGGQTTPQMLIRFNQDVIDLQPKAVVILAGINDIAQNTGPTTEDAIMNNISSMAWLARAHGIKVILSSVLPAYDFPWRPGLEPARKVVSLNRSIREFCEKNNFYYLDYYSSLVDARNGMKPAYASDEVHTTLDGYKVMEPLVEKAIENVLRKK